MAGRARRRPRVLGPRRGWEESASPALPRPRRGPTGPNPASRPASLPFPAAPPATPGPRLAVPPRTPELGPAASARGAAHSPWSAPRRRVPRAPLLSPQENSQTRTPSRDPGPPTARDPFLPPLPPHRLPTGLSPRPTGRRVWCEKGRLGAGLRAPPYGGGGGALSCRKLGGAWAAGGSPGPPRAPLRHVTVGC